MNAVRAKVRYTEFPQVILVSGDIHENVAIMMGACALLSSLAVVGSGSSARVADLPPYFKEIVGTQTASPAEIGTKNILQLNRTMFELYGDAGQIFKKNILASRIEIHLPPLRQIGGRLAHTHKARTDTPIAALIKR